MSSDNMGRPVKNRFAVGSATWGAWSNRARATFNRVYHEMRPSRQGFYLHPDTQPLPREQWDWIRWHAAHTAAQAVQ